MNKEYLDYLLDHSVLLKNLDLKNVVFLKTVLNRVVYVIAEADIKNKKQGKIIAFDLVLTDKGYVDRTLAQVEYILHESGEVILFNSPKIINYGAVGECLENCLMSLFEKFAYEQKRTALLGNVIYNELETAQTQNEKFVNMGYVFDESDVTKITKTLTQEHYLENVKKISPLHNTFFMQCEGCLDVLQQF